MTVEDKKEIRIQGVIERVTFHNKQTGFAVLRVKTGKENHTIVGQCSCVNEGEHISASGHWVMNDNYGLQLKASQLVLSPPKSESAIEKYLASGAIKGIGVHFAKSLIEHFGADVVDVIENNPSRLLEMPGIGKGRMKRIHQAWLAQAQMRDVMMFLHEHGFGSHRAAKIIRSYGHDAIARIKANPYCLTYDIQGIGFKSADALAISLGIAPDCAQRLAAASLYLLSQNIASGHTLIIFKDLIDKTVDLLSVDEALVTEAVKQNIHEGKLMLFEIGDKKFLADPSLADAEDQIASNILRLRSNQPAWQVKSQTFDKYSQMGIKNGVQLSTSQLDALEALLTHPVVVLTGGPGVGKTTLINSYLGIARSYGAYIQLCAPTGRAAKRLSEATQFEAKTIHRLLEYSPVDHKFKHNADNPIPLGGLVIDEASMLDTVLFNQLLQALPNNASLVLVGDVDQLPSVGAGMVLMDLIESNTVRIVRLKEVHRQAESSLIIENSHRINRGLLPITNSTRDSDFFFIAESDPKVIMDKIGYMLLNRIPTRYGLDPIKDVQILTPMNRGPLGSELISEYLQDVFKTSNSFLESGYSRYFIGDKVIQTVNNYDKEVFNGDIGYVEAIDHENTVMMINFDAKKIEYSQEDFDELKLAYAITIHKSQGSEYPVVIVPLTMSHYMMLQRNLIYTALTRAKQIAIFIGDKKAISMAVKKEESSRRVTRLNNVLKNKDSQ